MNSSSFGLTEVDIPPRPARPPRVSAARPRIESNRRRGRRRSTRPGRFCLGRRGMVSPPSRSLARGISRPGGAFDPRRSHSQLACRGSRPRRVRRPMSCARPSRAKTERGARLCVGGPAAAGSSKPAPRAEGYREPARRAARRRRAPNQGHWPFRDEPAGSTTGRAAREPSADHTRPRPPGTSDGRVWSSSGCSRMSWIGRPVLHVAQHVDGLRPASFVRRGGPACANISSPGPSRRNPK